MDELIVSIGAGIMIVVMIAIPWFIFVHFMLNTDKFENFNKRKH